MIVKIRNIVIEKEAIQILPKNAALIDEFAGDNVSIWHHEDNSMSVNVQTREGSLSAIVGDWIIKGLEGEFYPCADSVFQKSYEIVEDE